jgi:hypothetical protein
LHARAVATYSASHGGGFGFHAGGFGLRGRAGGLAAAASYLGTTPFALVDQLRSGKTLAQIADQTSGKSADGLIAALVADARQKIAAAVTANELTQAQADTIDANLQQAITDLVNGSRPPFPGPFDRGFGFRAAAGGLAAAASYLGATPAALVDQLRSGKTLAQIANQTSGKSADGLIAALVADAKQKLAAAVTANKLTQAEANTIEANLQQRIADLVNGTGPSFRAGFGFPGRLHDGLWRGPPASAPNA